MRKLMTAAVLAFSLMSVSVRAKDAATTDTLVVTTNPMMHCGGCENKIKSNVRFVKGTKSIETSIPNQTVTIIFDSSKATYAEYDEAFKKIGYEIKEVSK